MKLLFILPEYIREPVGGIRTFYVNLLPALARAGCEVKVLLARREFAGRQSFTDESGVIVEYVRTDLLEKHDRLFQQSQFSGRWLLGQFIPVANAAFEQVEGGTGFDAVEVTDWPLLFLPWVGRRKGAVPFTISLHSSVGQMMEYEGEVSDPLDFALVRMLEALGFAATDSIHANSNLNARYWEEITNRKVEVLLPVLAGSVERGAGSGDAQYSGEPVGRSFGVTEDEVASGGLRVKRRGTVEGDELGVTRGELGARRGETQHDERDEVTGDEWRVTSVERHDAAVASEGLGVKSEEGSNPLPATRDSLRATPRMRGAVFARLQNWKGCELVAKALESCSDLEVSWYGADVTNSSDGRAWSQTLSDNFPEVYGFNLIYEGMVIPEQVPALMAEADFVCVPSLWDVFNLSAVEAMSLGRVVLCSRQAGAEMLIEEGVNGFLFDPRDPGELCEKLRAVSALSAERKQQIGQAAQETVQRKLNGAAIVAERVAYYGKLAQSKPAVKRNAFLPDILELKPVAERSLGRKVYEAVRKLGV